MGKFTRKVARHDAPSKGELAAQFDGRLKALSTAIQQTVMLNNRQIEAISARVNEIGTQTDLADYRSLATMELLAEKGILTTDAHTEYVRVLKIRNFEEASAKDDAERKLTPVDGPSMLGHFLCINLEAHYPDTLEVPAVKDATLTGVDGTKGAEALPKETVPHPLGGQLVENLSILRSKVQIGSGMLHPDLEQQMVGLKKGETKEFSLVMPKEFKTFAGQTLKFKVEVFDVREEPPKPVAAAPTPPPATD